jgi:hypothetical protein
LLPARIRAIEPDFAYRGAARVYGILFAREKINGTRGDGREPPAKAGVILPEEEEDPMNRLQPIREIAPPAWPLPLIASQPRGPRRGA